MNSVQIICLVGVIIVTFLLGRSSKHYKFPIAGEFKFDNDEEKTAPLIKFKMDFDTMKKFNYVVFKIRGENSSTNERYDG